QRQPMTAGVERPVAIEQPRLVDAADNGAEAKIFGFFGGLEAGGGHCKTSGARCQVPEDSEEHFILFFFRFSGTWRLVPDVYGTTVAAASRRAFSSSSSLMRGMPL